MTSAYIAGDLTERALRLSATALAAGLYDTAYFGLQAALDCARLLPDDTGLVALDCQAAKMQGELHARRAAHQTCLTVDLERLTANLDDLQGQVATLLSMRQALRWSGAAMPAA
jgi:hypothetical protein